MQGSRHVPCVAVLGALVLLAGCSSTQAARGTGGSGSEGAIAQSAGECNQTDSTMTCCLKKHPGEYERCGAVAPRQRPKPSGNLLPPSALTPKQRTKRKELCQEFYERCIAAGGEDVEQGTYGHTHCQSCFDECFKTGLWPAELEGEPCPGSPQ